jgi:hypothetical protein
MCFETMGWGGRIKDLLRIEGKRWVETPPYDWFPVAEELG